MPAPSDPMDNPTHPDTNRSFKAVADRLMRRKSAAGVALPLTLRRLARITRASNQIRKNHLDLPGGPQRARMKRFGAKLRQKQVRGPQASGGMIGKGQSGSWEPLELSLPNGASAESSQGNILRAGMGDVGFLGAGQVIAPFNPPVSSSETSTREPSFVERRRARLNAQEAKKPTSGWKKPEPSARLYSRVEEIKPSGRGSAGNTAATPPAADQAPAKSQEPRTAPPAPVKAEPVEQPMPEKADPKGQSVSEKQAPVEPLSTKKPTAVSGKPPLVQRQLAPGAATDSQRAAEKPEPISQPAPVEPEPKPASSPAETKVAAPGESHPDTRLDLQTLAPRKPVVKPAVEEQKHAPEQPVSVQKVPTQTAPASKQEPGAPANAQPLTTPPPETQSRPTPPPQKPVETKPSGKTGEESTSTGSPLSGQKPAVPPVLPVSSPPSPTLQREPERSVKPAPVKPSAAPEPAPKAGTIPAQEPPQKTGTKPAQEPEPIAGPIPAQDIAPKAEAHAPLDLPLAAVKPPARQGEKPDPEQPVSNSATAAQPALSETAKPLDSQPPAVVEKAGKPVSRAASKSETQSLEKITTQPPLKKSVVARSPINRSISYTKKIAARSKPGLIHRQMRRGAPQSIRPALQQPETRLPRTDQNLEAGGSASQVVRSAVQPVVSEPSHPIRLTARPRSMPADRADEANKAGGEDRPVVRAVTQPQGLKLPQTRRQDNALRWVPRLQAPVRPALRVSVRPLTAAQAAPVRRASPRKRTARGPLGKKPAGTQTAVKMVQPLLLSQRNQPRMTAADKAPGASRADVVPAQPSRSTSEERHSQPVALPTSFSTVAGHTPARNVLVTHTGIRVIQRQLRRPFLPGKFHPTGDLQIKPDGSAPQQPAALRPEPAHTRSQTPAIPSQRPASVKRTASEPRMEQPAVVKQPAKSESARTNPAELPAELPVVLPRPATAVEQVVQREVAVPGPVAERPAAEPEIQTAQADEHKDENLDLGKLARDIFPIIKRMIAVEKERSSGRLY